MAHTIKDKSKLLARIRRIQGQLRSLETRLDAEADCTEVLQQIAAVRGAVNGLMGAVIEGHILDHVVHESRPDRREVQSEVFLQVLKSYFK